MPTKSFSFRSGAARAEGVPASRPFCLHYGWPLAGAVSDPTNKDSGRFVDLWQCGVALKAGQSWTRAGVKFFGFSGRAVLQTLCQVDLALPARVHLWGVPGSACRGGRTIGASGASGKASNFRR